MPPCRYVGGDPIEQRRPVGSAVPEPGPPRQTGPVLVPGLRYVAVAGGSMAPTLRAGDWVLVRRSSRVDVGDVVVLEHPHRPGLLMVKRVAEVRADGYYLLGDAPDASTDSRHFGAVREVFGPVVWRVRPWGRVR